MEARRQVRPPVQPICEKGDVMLRDLRMWHAGMPNESEDYRIMLALGYQVRFLTRHFKLLGNNSVLLASGTSVFHA